MEALWRRHDMGSNRVKLIRLDQRPDESLPSEGYSGTILGHLQGNGVVVHADAWRDPAVIAKLTEPVVPARPVVVRLQMDEPLLRQDLERTAAQLLGQLVIS